MKNVNREVKASSMRSRLESIGVSTTKTNRFIQLLDRTIKSISAARVTPDQIREENRRRALIYSGNTQRLKRKIT